MSTTEVDIKMSNNDSVDYDSGELPRCPECYRHVYNYDKFMKHAGKLRDVAKLMHSRQMDQELREINNSRLKLALYLIPCDDRHDNHLEKNVEQEDVDDMIVTLSGPILSLLSDEKNFFQAMDKLDKRITTIIPAAVADDVGYEIYYILHKALFQVRQYKSGRDPRLYRGLFGE